MRKNKMLSDVGANDNAGARNKISQVLNKMKCFTSSGLTFQNCFLI